MVTLHAQRPDAHSKNVGPVRELRLERERRRVIVVAFVPRGPIPVAAPGDLSSTVPVARVAGGSDLGVAERAGSGPRGRVWRVVLSHPVVAVERRSQDHLAGW